MAAAAPSSIIELTVPRLRLCLGEFISHRVIVVLHATSVIGIVCPLLKIPIDVDIDITMIPIDIVPDLAGNSVSYAPGDTGRNRTTNDIARRWRIVVLSENSIRLDLRCKAESSHP